MWSKYVDTPYRFVQPALAVLNKRQEVVTAWSWSMSGYKEGDTVIIYCMNP